MGEIESLTKIANYLKVPVGKIQYNAENELEMQQPGNKDIKGFSSKYIHASFPHIKSCFGKIIFFCCFFRYSIEHWFQIESCNNQECC